jgi:hypothetical protein
MKTKSREKFALVAFLLAVLSLAHAVNSRPTAMTVSLPSNAPCPNCARGYDLYFAPANHLGSPTTASENLP